MNSSPVRPVPDGQVLCSNRYELLAPNEEADETQEDDGDHADHGERAPHQAPRIEVATKEMREAHEAAGHATYRSWCRACVAGRGRSKYHRRIDREDVNCVPVVSMDYGFLGPQCELCEGDDTQVLLTFLGLRDRKSRSIAGLTVPHKGPDNGYPVSRVVRQLDEWGRGDVILRSDQEPAIEQLKRCIKEKRAESTALEHTARGDHAGNGDAESAVQMVAGMARTLKVALEEKLKRRVGSTHAVIKWLIEYGAVAHNLFKVGSDGFTNYERRTGGRKFKRVTVPFGQKILYEHRPRRDPRCGAHLGKLEARFEEGVFLGIKCNSMTYLVGDAHGDVVESNVIRPFPPDQHWDAEWIMNIKGVPWDPTPSRAREALEEEAEVERAEHEMPPPVDYDEEVQRRGTYITRRLIAKYGKTKGCPGCYGGGVHNEACRRRIEEHMMDEDAETKARVQERRRNRNARARPDEEPGDSEEERPSNKRRKASGISREARSEVPDTQTQEQPSASSGSGASSNQEARASEAMPPTTAHEAGGRTRARSDDTKDDHGKPDEERPTKKKRTEEANVMREVAMIHSLLENRTDISEIYSTSRVTTSAWRMNMTTGLALDLTVPREDGKMWDFRLAEMRSEARRLVTTLRPRLLVGSPPGTMYSALQDIPKAKRDHAVLNRLMIEANTHLLFCVELYRDQVKRGAYFLHEHPEGGISWEHPEMNALAEAPGVRRFVGHGRADSMSAANSVCEDLVLKPTGWLTNSEFIGEEVSRKCPSLDNAWWEHQHRHVQLLSGRASACQVYPSKLRRAILRGLVKQLRYDQDIPKDGVGIVCDDQVDIEGNGFDHPHEDREYAEFYHGATFTDDISGKELPAEGVIKARAQELEFVDSRPVYKEVPVEECWEKTGKPPLGTKWVDIDKGGPGGHVYRSRWVAQQFRDSPNDEFFAATPPYETLKLFLSLAASLGSCSVQGRSRKLSTTSAKRRTANNKMRNMLGLPEIAGIPGAGVSGALKLDLLDVSRAHFNGEPAEETFVELPPERRRPGVCGKLVSNMYGTRGAAAAWEKNYSNHMAQWGFTRGIANACVFVHSERLLMTMVHGDDFFSLGSDADLDWFGQCMGQVYQYKHVGRIGPEPEDHKALRVLNRVVSWTDRGLELEADQRHADLVVRELGLESANSVNSPGEKGIETKDNDKELDEGLVTKFRAVAARINFLAQDRHELLYPAKEVCRSMSKPTVGAWMRLKRIGRYLRGCPRLVQRFDYQELPMHFKVYADSDWAGCRTTRKSTSGGCLMLGRHVIRGWSSTQAVIALSSGEAEYYAMLKAASMASGMRAIADDLGVYMDILLYSDSKAARGIVKRSGLGKTRHLAVCYLWLQEKVARKEIEVRTVAGIENPADLMTKYQTNAGIQVQWERMSSEIRQGRHHMMTKLN